MPDLGCRLPTACRARGIRLETWPFVWRATYARANPDGACVVLVDFSALVFNRRGGRFRGLNCGWRWGDHHSSIAEPGDAGAVGFGDDQASSQLRLRQRRLALPASRLGAIERLQDRNPHDLGRGGAGIADGQPPAPRFSATGDSLAAAGDRCLPDVAAHGRPAGYAAAP